MLTDQIVQSTHSGGANTSHTIVFPALVRVLSEVRADAPIHEYERVVLDDNALGKETLGARQRTLRYLRELYFLRPDALLFRALRDLWPDDPTGQPLLAGLCALARDPSFRASSPAILGSHPGEVVTSDDLAEAVESSFPSAYNESTLAKIGRNTLSSWEQTGHLQAATAPGKIRTRAICTPSAVAYALLLGHIEGIAGAALFETLWAKVLDHPRPHLLEQAVIASQRGLIDFRNSGGIIDVGFSELLRPIEGLLL